jgi:hypothetical protein
MLEATTVSKAILAAANSTRLEIIVPFYARVGVWFKYTFPYVVNPVVRELFVRELNRTPGRLCHKIRYSRLCIVFILTNVISIPFQ